MNRPALEALRESLRQTIGTTVSPFALCCVLDALLAPDGAAADIPGLVSGGVRPIGPNVYDGARCQSRPLALWETA